MLLITKMLNSNGKQRFKYQSFPIPPPHPLQYYLPLITFSISLSIQIFIKMNQPTRKWGPADPQNRTIPRYQRSGPDQVPHTNQAHLENPEVGGSNLSLPPPYPGYERSPPDFQEKDNKGFHGDTLENELTKL